VRRGGVVIVAGGRRRLAMRRVVGVGLGPSGDCAVGMRGTAIARRQRGERQHVAHQPRGCSQAKMPANGAHRSSDYRAAAIVVNSTGLIVS
jgi:hypothetical protein